MTADQAVWLFLASTAAILWTVVAVLIVRSLRK